MFTLGSPLSPYSHPSSSNSYFPSSAVDDLLALTPSSSNPYFHSTDTDIDIDINGDVSSHQQQQQQYGEASGSGGGGREGRSSRSRAVVGSGAGAIAGGGISRDRDRDKDRDRDRERERDTQRRRRRSSPPGSNSNNVNHTNGSSGSGGLRRSRGSRSSGHLNNLVSNNNGGNAAGEGEGSTSGIPRDRDKSRNTSTSTASASTSASAPTDEDYDSGEATVTESSSHPLLSSSNRGNANSSGSLHGHRSHSTSGNGSGVGERRGCGDRDRDRDGVGVGGSVNSSGSSTATGGGAVGISDILVRRRSNEKSRVLGRRSRPGSPLNLNLGGAVTGDAQRDEDEDEDDDDEDTDRPLHHPNGGLLSPSGLAGSGGGGGGSYSQSRLAPRLRIPQANGNGNGNGSGNGNGNINVRFHLSPNDNNHLQVEGQSRASPGGSRQRYLALKRSMSSPDAFELGNGIGFGAKSGQGDGQGIGSGLGFGHGDGEGEREGREGERNGEGSGKGDGRGRAEDFFSREAHEQYLAGQGRAQGSSSGQQLSPGVQHRSPLPEGGSPAPPYFSPPSNHHQSHTQPGPHHSVRQNSSDATVLPSRPISITRSRPLSGRNSLTTSPARKPESSPGVGILPISTALGIPAEQNEGRSVSVSPPGYTPGPGGYVVDQNAYTSPTPPASVQLRPMNNHFHPHSHAHTRSLPQNGRRSSSSSPASVISALALSPVEAMQRKVRNEEFREDLVVRQDGSIAGRGQGQEGSQIELNVAISGRVSPGYNLTIGLPGIGAGGVNGQGKISPTASLTPSGAVSSEGEKEDEKASAMGQTRIRRRRMPGMTPFRENSLPLVSGGTHTSSRTPPAAVDGSATPESAADYFTGLFSSKKADSPEKDRPAYASKVSSRNARLGRTTSNSSISTLGRNPDSFRSNGTDLDTASNADSTAFGGGSLGLMLSEGEASMRRFGRGSLTSASGAEMPEFRSGPGRAGVTFEEQPTWFVLKSVFERSPKAQFRARLEEKSGHPKLLFLLRLLSVVPAMIGITELLKRMVFGKEGELFGRSDAAMALPWAVLTGIFCFELTSGLTHRWLLYYDLAPTLLRLLSLQSICWPCTFITLRYIGRIDLLFAWIVVGTTTACSRSIQIWVTSNVPEYLDKRAAQTRQAAAKSNKFEPNPADSAYAASPASHTTDNSNTTTHAPRLNRKESRHFWQIPERRLDWVEIGQSVWLRVGILYLLTTLCLLWQKHAVPPL